MSPGMGENYRHYYLRKDVGEERRMEGDEVG